MDEGRSESSRDPSSFFDNGDFRFEAQGALGRAPLGALDIGLVLTAIRATVDGNADSWFAAWRGVARRLHDQASSCLAAGHEETAAQYFLGASEAHFRSTVFAARMSHPRLAAEAFAEHRACWEAFVDASGGRVVRLTAECGDATMPIYLLRPASDGARRPTLVLTNGSDGPISAMMAAGASAALARGWNAVVYDGPGQGVVFTEQHVPFRSDWEAVLTPIVDLLVDRADVDESAMFAYGMGQGGYWVPRALAFERRFVAAAVDPGVTDVSAAWMALLPPELITLLRSGDAEAFNDAMGEVERRPAAAREFSARSRAYGFSSHFDLFTALKEYDLGGVFSKIRTPMLIAAPENERFWPGQSEELYQQLEGDRELAHFTREMGADGHCEPLGRTLVELRMFDYFTHRLAALQR